MTNENNTYDKLNYFFTEKIKVFFTLKTGQFRKGMILDLNSKMRTVVLKEDVLGDIPILFEEINWFSIQIAKDPIEDEARFVRGDQEW